MVGDTTSLGADKTLEARWLGRRVRYGEALDLQQGLFRSGADYLLMCEHTPTFTMGVRGTIDDFRVSPEMLSAEVLSTKRGGQTTFHGPGQLVVYPIITLSDAAENAYGSSREYVRRLEKVLIDVLGDCGVQGSVIEGSVGVWVEHGGAPPAKVAAIGVRTSRGRTIHGFSLNVDLDLGNFEAIVPCGESERGVTSLKQLGVDVELSQLRRLVVDSFAEEFRYNRVSLSEVSEPDRHDDDLAPFSRGSLDSEVSVNISAKNISAKTGSMSETSSGSSIERKPEWMKVRFETGPNYRALRKRSKGLELHTVCEEAGCPNISECWNDGTATFMLLGDKCTRRCGFCLIDTNKPLETDLGEPKRVATAIEEMGLDFAVLTMVARDDLGDHGAAIVADTVRAIHTRTPSVGVEVLISDFGGDRDALDLVIESSPQVLNHNLETVARLQRRVRPQASYWRSLALLAAAGEAGLVTKSGIMVGLGETDQEVEQALLDLSNVGVDIVTIGQYLQPTSSHLRVDRWVEPSQFDRYREIAESMGIRKAQSTPLTRSSHHAGAIARSVLAESQPQPVAG